MGEPFAFDVTLKTLELLFLSFGAAYFALRISCMYADYIRKKD